MYSDVATWLQHPTILSPMGHNFAPTQGPQIQAFSLASSWSLHNYFNNKNNFLSWFCNVHANIEGTIVSIWTYLTISGLNIYKLIYRNQNSHWKDFNLPESHTVANWLPQSVSQNHGMAFPKNKLICSKNINMRSFL